MTEEELVITQIISFIQSEIDLQRTSILPSEATLAGIHLRDDSIRNIRESFVELGLLNIQTSRLYSDSIERGVRVVFIY
jgi:hypothetical protein